MTNEERRNIIDQAKAQGYQGSYVDLFRQAAAFGGADPMFAALSNQDRAEGLAPYHEAGAYNVGMTFPDVGPNEPMNTMRTRVPIDIKKYDDKTGHLVASHLSVPPGMTNVDSGPRRGTVVETPTRRQSGGYNPGGYMNEMQPKVFPNQKRDAKWVKYATDHDFAGRFPGETRTNEQIGLERSNRNTVPLPPNPARPKELKRAQEGGPKFAYEGQKTRMSSDITPEQAEMLMANQINVLPEVEIGGEATTPRAQAVAQANRTLGMEGGNQMRDMLEGLEEMDRAVGVPIARTAAGLGAMAALPYVMAAAPEVGGTVIAVNGAVAKGGAQLTRGVNAVASAIGRGQVGQLGSRFLTNTELGQGIRAAGQGAKWLAGKVGQAGQAVNNAVMGTRAGQAISSVYNAPINIMGGMSAADAVKLGVTIQGIQSLPKVPGYVASGQLGKAASTMLKVPGLKAAPAMAQIKNVKTLHDASAGAQAAADIGSAEDLSDVAAVTKMLPNTSGLRTIASGVDALANKKHGGYARLQEGNYKDQATGGEQTIGKELDSQGVTEKYNNSNPDYTWSWWDSASPLDKAGKLINFIVNPSSTFMSSLLQEGKHRIAQNIKPYGYDDAGIRLIDAVIENKPELGSAASREEGEDVKPWMQERTDLLNILLGEDQEYNSIPKSEYAPSKSSGYGNEYYASPTTEAWIRRQIEARGADKFIKSIDSKRDPETGAASHYWTSKDSHGNVLGNYIIDVGEDEKGKYISYYDKWDLNPFGGNNQGARMTESAIQRVLGINPPEVYGRVYLRKGGFLKRPSGI